MENTLEHSMAEMAGYAWNPLGQVVLGAIMLLPLGWSKYPKRSLAANTHNLNPTQLTLEGVRLRIH